jgi:hypothetical protein
MKTRMLLSASLVLLALNFLGGHCYGQNYVPKPEEEIYGKWINDKVYNLNGFQKIVTSADGLKLYAHVSDSVPWVESTEQIDSKWIDSEGNIWQKTFIAETSGSNKGIFQGLDRFSKSATVWECVIAIVKDFNPSSYPTRIDPKDSSYRLYYRAEK